MGLAWFIVPYALGECTFFIIYYFSRSFGPRERERGDVMDVWLVGRDIEGDVCALFVLVLWGRRHYGYLVMIRYVL
jgi:hypothetical protein